VDDLGCRQRHALQQGVRNFLLYEAQLRQRNLALYELLHRLTVVNRGSLGELRFTLPP
jgi:hypothetical protein